MPTTPGLGHKSYLQMFKETTYGTRATSNGKKLEVISMGIDPDVGMINDPSLYSQPSRRDLYQGGLLYRGRTRFRLNYEGLEEAFRAVFGGYSGTTVETGVRDHTYIENATLPSYSLEMIEGDIATNTCQLVLGAIATSFEFGITAGQGDDGMGYGEFEWIAKDKTSGATPTGSLSFPATLPVLFHQHTSVISDGATTPGSLVAKEVSVKLENKVSDDRFGMIGGASGSPNILQPLRNDFLDVTWRFRNEFATIELAAAARSFTNGVPRVFFQHPTTIGATSKREFEMRSSKAKLKSYANEVAGYGIIEATAEWMASFDSGDASALIARFRNTNTALP